MATPTNFKETTRKQAEFRRQKSPFKNCKTEREKVSFLSAAEPFAREFMLLQGGNGYAWYPTLAGIPFYDDKWLEGFKTPEEAYGQAVLLKAEFAEQLASMPS